MATVPSEAREVVVILGAGFAGIACARRLQRRLRGRRDVHVVLVDRENHTVFQPLLPEVAAGTLAPQDVIHPVRALAPGVDVDCAEVVALDLAARTVTYRSPEGVPFDPVRWTRLVLACGQAANMAVLPGLAAHGLPVKTVGDALRVRNHVLQCIEHAANTSDAAVRDELLTLVTVGAGFSGVETCAEVHDMACAALRYFPELRTTRVRSVLVSATDRILPALSPHVSQVALDTLRHRGIDVRLDTRTRSVTPRGAFLDTGELIPTRTVIGTIGTRPHPLVLDADLPLERGRVRVGPDLRVEGRDDVWAVGDCAWIVNGRDGAVCPATAQFAQAEGVACADNLLATLDGAATTPFAFTPKGYAASLGHLRAVVESGAVRLSGFLGWFVWRTMYLVKLPGVARKVRVAFDWAFDLVFPRDICQLDTSVSDRVGARHYQPGQVIVAQGDDGDAFFMIERGAVEVVRDDVVVATLGAGEHFGEEALLTGARRNATVRATAPTDVRFVTRDDFAALTAGIGGLAGMVRRA